MKKRNPRQPKPLKGRLTPKTMKKPYRAITLDDATEIWGIIRRLEGAITMLVPVCAREGHAMGNLSVVAQATGELQARMHIVEQVRE